MVSGVSGIIILYFPSQALLERLLLSMRDQVKKIYVVDNTLTDSLEWLNSKWFYEFGLDIEYISLGDNYGIAKAQNVGIDLAMRDGFDHVIFFDQDSAPSEFMVDKLFEAESALLNAGIKVGSVGPLFIDEKTGKYSKAIRHGILQVNKINILPGEKLPVDADYVIASGSLIQVDILREVGCMQEDLFIDWVDIEWGLRAKKFGCKNFIIPDAVMMHSIGDEVISFGGRDINLHNDVRNYYIVRNACYLLSRKTMGWRWRLNVFFKIPQYVIFYSMTSISKNKKKSFVLLMRACLDGFRQRLGKAF